MQSKVQSLDQLQSHSPEELIALAELIVEKRASSLAIETMDRKPERQKDEVLLQTMMCT